MNALTHDMPNFTGDPKEVLDYVNQWRDINPFGMASQFLWDGDPAAMDKTLVRSICSALQMARYQKLISPAQYFICTRRVLKLLDEHLSVENYLTNCDGVRQKDLSHKNIQFFRHRWLDHLAKEWAEGVRT